MSDVLVDARGVSKKFCRELKRSLWYGLHDLASEITGRRGSRTELRPGEFWAVDNVSFTVRRGECLGLIGRNGAGKTTLLRMLTGLIKPNGGRIEMQGKLGALIALGGGVKEILTGRENIYSMAALRGLRRAEIDARFDEIVDFAELGDFLDTPVQNYSSGMKVKLNFSVAAALDPDVLILDEVLAVGDAAFRNKCYQRIADIRKRTAVIFVSHNMEQVARISDSVLVMSKGVGTHFQNAEEGIERYNALNLPTSVLAADAFLSLRPPISGFRVSLSATQVASGDPLQITLEIDCKEKVKHFLLKVHFYNARGAFAADAVLRQQDHCLELREGRNTLQLGISQIPLKTGLYQLAFNVIDRQGDMIVWSYKQTAIAVENAYSGAISDCFLSGTLSALNQSIDEPAS